MKIEQILKIIVDELNGGCVAYCLVSHDGLPSLTIQRIKLVDQDIQLKGNPLEFFRKELLEEL